MPPRPTLDGAAPTRPMLTLVPADTPVPRECPYRLQRPSEFPPGVWEVGPDPDEPGYVVVHFVSGDQRRLQRMSITAAELVENSSYFRWWWDHLNGQRMRHLAHGCPECPARPAELPNTVPRRA